MQLLKLRFALSLSRSDINSWLHQLLFLTNHSMSKEEHYHVIVSQNRAFIETIDGNRLPVHRASRIGSKLVSTAETPEYVYIGKQVIHYLSITVFAVCLLYEYINCLWSRLRNSGKVTYHRGGKTRLNLEFQQIFWPQCDLKISDVCAVAATSHYLLLVPILL